MQHFLENALMGTILILAVLFLRHILHNRLPVGTWLALWGLCLVRLLSPFMPSSPISIYGLPHLIMSSDVADTLLDATASRELVTANELMSEGISPHTTHVTEQAAENVAASTGAGITAIHILLALYLAGVFCMLTWFIYSWIREYRLIREAKLIDRGDNRYMSLPRHTRLREGMVEGAPFTFGIILPTIVIPPGLCGNRLKIVLMHEAVHAKRRDNLWHIAVAIALFIYWWNPAVWLMSRYLRRDVEMSCDHAVLTKLGYDFRKEYAESVISLSTKGRSPAFSHSFGYKYAEERIRTIMKFKKSSFFATALAIVLVFSVGFTFAASATSSSYHPTSYEDVDPAATYASAVRILSDANIMQGVSETRFNPQGEVNRAMAVTVLGRLAGATQKESNAFSDVEANSWYSGYIGWAVEKGIIQGDGAGHFMPNATVSSEHLNLMIRRYAETTGRMVIDLPDSGNPTVTRGELAQRLVLLLPEVTFDDDTGLPATDVTYNDRTPEIVIDDETGDIAFDVIYYQTASEKDQKPEEVDKIVEGTVSLPASSFALNSVPISTSGTRWIQPDGCAACGITVTNTQNDKMKVTISYDENNFSFYVPANSTYSYVVKNAWTGCVHTLDFSSDNGTVSGSVSVQIAAGN